MADATTVDADARASWPTRGRHAARVAVVVLVLGLGIGARFTRLGAQPIWHDEVYTRVFAAGYHSQDWIDALYVGTPVTRDAVLRYQHVDPARDALDTIGGLALDEPQHPPAYYVLARLWMGVFGDSLAALRALSAVMSLLALVAAAWLARELFGSDRRARDLAVALVVLSPFVVLYAREAREYALWSALIMASCAALLRAMRLSGAASRRRLGAWLAFAALSALGLYTSFSHAAVVLAQALFVAISARARLTRTSVAAALALLVTGLAFLPWGLLLLEHMEAFKASMDWARMIVVPASEVVTSLVVTLGRPLMDLWTTVDDPLAWVVALATLALVIVSFVRVARRGPREPRALLLTLAIVPLVLLVGPDLVFGGIRSLSARYLLPVLLAVLFAVAYGVANVAGARWRAALTVVVLGVAGGSALRDMLVDVPWTRALSAGLPRVAAAIDQAPRPLVIGDRERHHPGNLLALATLVGPDTEMLLLDFPARDALLARAIAAANHPAYPPAGLPSGHTLFVYAPVPQLLEALEAANGGPATLVWRDQHVVCWRLDPPPPRE